MKDYNKESLESSRPTLDAETCIRHVLECLYADTTRDTDEEIVKSLTFEELIGTLLEAKDEIHRLEESLYAEQEASK